MFTVCAESARAASEIASKFTGDAYVGDTRRTTRSEGTNLGVMCSI